jgi:hypothetical protein
MRTGYTINNDSLCEVAALKKQVEKNIRYTLATFAVEKLVPSKDAVRLCRDTANGKIGIGQAVRTMKEKYKASGV